MAVKKEGARRVIVAVRKSTSQGQGGRGRSCRICTSSMPKGKKRSHKSYRGQGR
jgi:NADH:ubiquinone oxidoreductase subunit F (NADH-binding)